ncbi:MAG: hypothetical protein ACRDT6_11150 [Micromonosporaceae bacterium]
MTVRYAVVLTRVRPVDHRDERARPEAVICRCVFDHRDVALRTARGWAATGPVLAGRERVKIILAPAG